MVEIKEIVHRVKDPRIIFLLVALFFGFEYFIFGPFSYARVSDNLDAFAERAILGWRSLFAQGLIGHWQPFFAGGMDRLANMASFGEIGNLIFIFPPWLASALIIVGGIFLGGYFTFRLSHEILGLSKKASLIAGILLSLFFVTEDLTPFIFGIAIFPVVLFCLEKIFSAPHLTWLKKAAATLLIGMLYSLFSSLVLTLPFTALATVLWFLLIRKQKSPIFYLFLFLFFLPAGLFKLQEAWSLLINSPLSRRGAEAVHYKASIKQYLVLVKTLMVRNAISLPFAAAGLFIAKRKPLSTKLIFVTFFLLLVAPLYPLLAGTELGKFLGPLRNFDFSRFYLLIPFFAALAAAFFIDYFRDLQVNISSVNGTQQRRLNL